IIAVDKQFDVSTSDQYCKARK
ncbi:uncharacterized protein METZ01_LOCUS327469, partial [marine metagenome]